MRVKFLLTFICVVWFLSSTNAEDGSKLWLRYDKVAESIVKSRKISARSTSPIIRNAKKELELYWAGGDVELLLNNKLVALKDGFKITSRRRKIVIEAAQERGLLYGAYRLLQLQKANQIPSNLTIIEKPSYDVRILNHWDNLDGTIERGYAGYSLWKWEDLPAKISPRYEEYARANASIGINATVLNNVNASPQILSSEYLKKVKIIADIFRNYGIKVYLSANFSSPKVLGNLENSDPTNPEVLTWWKDKADEIYKLIPDFGGFLVKANSEGQPGPQDYGRSHADGANMLADVLKPHKGIVMWRAFVYNPNSEDRAKQAYNEFVPLDGQFRDNVIIQIKNGPIDFQPREPFTPLFGAMAKTAQMVEFQITQEYLGFSNHLVFLAPLFKETLDADTYANGKGSTIAKITDGSLRHTPTTAISAVANIGEDTNWTGHHFAQANWYAFGRLAWDHQLSSEAIAQEWIRSTWTDSLEFVNAISEMMMDSREAVVDYMMPLGLHHIFAFDHHYGPEPWGDVPGGRPDWMPWYYHNADSVGLGFDRTVTGSNAVAQYRSPLDSIYGDISSCPENLILYFHHVRWGYKMRSGRTMWDELCYKYQVGVDEVRGFQSIWEKFSNTVDKERFDDVADRLKIQIHDAVWWKDACTQYFQEFSKRKFPEGIDKPVRSLDELKKIKLDLKHHN